jgi:hypothetical protein
LLEGEPEMKKLAILIMTSAFLLSLASGGYAAEFLGYSMVPKQLKFYTIILSVIGVSMAMVSAVHISLWVADLKKFSLPWAYSENGKRR